MKHRSLKIAIAAASLLPGLLCAAPEKYQVDPEHSFVNYKIRHFGISDSRGTFRDFSGSFTLDREDPTKSSFDFEVDAESVSSNNASRDKFIKSPDFLNTKQFPAITFESQSTKKISDKEYEVTGQLTLGAETKPVTAKLVQIGAGKGPKGDDRIGGEVTFTVKRSEFGMNQLLDKLGDEIHITVGVEAFKEK